MKKNKRQLVSLFLLILFIVSATTITASAADPADAYADTYSDLQSAISTAPTDGSAYIIEITNNIDFTGPLNIAGSKNIIIQSGSGGPWKLIQNTGRHFTLASGGKLTLQDIILDGGTVYDANNTVITSGAGGISMGNNTELIMNTGAVIQYCNTTGSGAGVNLATSGGQLIMNTGAVIQYCRSTASGAGVNLASSGNNFIMNGGVIENNTTIQNGGGINLVSGSTFTMNNGTIKNNTAGQSGGGVNTGNGTFNMHDGTISDNKTSSNGGGVNVNQGVFTMDGGIISTNHADLNGGGVNLMNLGKFIMNGGALNNNIAGQSGGGIYMLSNSALEITGTSGTCSITDNAAASDGGGIYTADTSYSNILSADSTMFSGNTASALYMPPADAATVYPLIGFSSVSASGAVDHPINNYDINYTSGTKIDQYTITVQTEGNGTASSSETSAFPGTEIILTADPDNTGYYLKEWQVVSGGITITDNKFAMPSSNVTVKAIFESTTYTIIFESNGGTLVDSQTVAYGEKVVEPTAPTKQDYIFSGWYTDNNIFENEWNFNTDTVTEDLTLYAKWTPGELDTPKTGDNTLIWMFILFTSLAIIGYMLLLISRRKWNGKY